MVTSVSASLAAAFGSREEPSGSAVQHKRHTLRAGPFPVFEDETSLAFPRQTQRCVSPYVTAPAEPPMFTMETIRSSL
jgi:hypothetical protein